VIKTYKELEEKYGGSSAEILFDLIPVMKSDCYEGEIRIE
jgi:hypothetical protein